MPDIDVVSITEYQSFVLGLVDVVRCIYNDFDSIDCSDRSHLKDVLIAGDRKGKQHLYGCKDGESLE